MKEFFDVIKDVFVGEIGDKTMMVTLGLAELFAIRWVLLGIAPSCFFVPAVGVLIGAGLKGVLPVAAITYACAALFAALAWWSICEAQAGGVETRTERTPKWWHRFVPGTALRWVRIGVFLLHEAIAELKVWAKRAWWASVVLAFILFSVAETADRTQMITITKTVQGSDWAVDWFGSSVGLLAANIVALLVFYFARWLLRRRVLMFSAAVLFAVSAGRMLLLILGGHEPQWYWVVLATAVGVATYPIAAKLLRFPTGPDKPAVIYRTD